MKQIKVYFTDGNSLITSINGSDAEILAYYVGQSFELIEGKMSVCSKVEFPK